MISLLKQVLWPEPEETTVPCVLRSDGKRLPKDLLWTHPGYHPDMLRYDYGRHAVVPDYSNPRWDDPEPHEDPRQMEFDFEFFEPMDAGVPCG